MLRQDFISKIIEQLFTAIAKLLNIDVEKETEMYLASFEELLKTYFKIHSESLSKLLEEDEERDAFLLDEKLRTTQLTMFCQAGLGYLKIGESEKAQNCLHIIERIQTQQPEIFEFPSSESAKLEAEIESFQTKLQTFSK